MIEFGAAKAQQSWLKEVMVQRTGISLLSVFFEKKEAHRYIAPVAEQDASHKQGWAARQWGM